MSHIPQNFLFRLRLPCRRLAPSAVAAFPTAEALGREHAVPFWAQVKPAKEFGASSNAPGIQALRNAQNESAFDFRIGWAREGLLFTVVVSHKNEQKKWSRSALNEADCVRLCLDMRDLKDAHRCSRFCCKLLFYPLVGEKNDSVKPFAQWTPIDRAKASPSFVDVDAFRLASARRNDGYAFSAFLPSSTLPGYDTDEINRIGIHYVVRDSHYGEFVLQHAEPFPIESDPSLWASLTFEP